MNQTNSDLFNQQAIIQKLKAKLARQNQAVAETLQHINAMEQIAKQAEADAAKAKK